MAKVQTCFLASNFRVPFFVEAKKPNVGLENPLYYFKQYDTAGTVTHRFHAY